MSINRDSSSKSPWQQVKAPASTNIQPDSENVYDAAIVGGGITGITTALLLQRKGKKCILLEAGNIGFGTTGGTTAHINTFFDSTYPEIEKDFGGEGAKLVASAGKEAMEMIEKLVRTYKIDCDLEVKSGYLFSQTDEQTKQLAEILAAAQKAKVAATEADENGVPIPFQHSLLFSGQAQFHPTKYILALAKEFDGLGGVIMENTFVSKADFEDGVCTISDTKVNIRAKHLVYATHVPPGVNLFSFRCAPYRSYVLGLTLTSDEAYPEDLAYDMEEPYHYFRTHVIEGKKILILGGEDHKTGHADPEQAFLNLEEYAHKYFNVRSIKYKWSSQYYVPVDGLPYIGPMTGDGDTTFVATGFNGNGMTWGTIPGMLITDAILKKKNKYAELFRPYRLKPIAGFVEFVKENADVAYHFIAGRLKTDELGSLSELAKGEGKVVEFKGEKIAIYKDDDGTISALHPTCTHAGCIVNFNSAEKSWDCPCHGGRFSLSGKVLSGPPRADLPPVTLAR